MIVCCFFSLNSYAVLPEFTLTVTKTDESCLGNGTLTFSVSGTDPAASVEYRIYQLPDTTNPIAVQTDNFLGGRTSGTYLVIAVQSLGGESNSQQQEITINSTVIPLAYIVNSTTASCGPDASISITMTSGVGAFYEIISGPVIRTPQTSPVFNNLPGGMYEVRVIDDCGVGWVTTHTVISDAATSLTVGHVSFPNPQLPDCDHIVVSNTLTPSPGDSLSYPINVEYTIHPPGGGAPITITKTVALGGADSQEVQTIIPLYYGQLYLYDITATDNCGNTFTLPNNIVDIELTVSLVPEPAECGHKFLSIQPMFYTFPIQVTWITVPADFDPTAFNAGHPGPFNDEPILYGDESQPVPWGDYIVQITDGCGHTAQDEVSLEFVPPDPVADIQPYPGCQSNTSVVTIEIPGFIIVSAVISAAPSAYPNPIPHDVSMFITDEGLILDPLITGNYTVHLIDGCDNEYDFDFLVPDTATSVAASTRVDCQAGLGAIRIRGASTILTSVIMTSAPAAFANPLPYDVSFNITPNGIFSMSELPPGSYGFTVTDNCGLSHTVNVANVQGFTETANDFTLTPHCGSFDLTLNYVSNTPQGFWLQRFDETTGTWGHPDTGVPYTEGTPPNATNSYLIVANAPTLNLIFTGQFRIMRAFQSFENGSVGEFKDCMQAIQEFEYTGIFEITGFEKITCSGTTASIRVLTNGVPPLTYKIIKKNGQPFFVDNGGNNIFTDLEQAIYTFEVQHSCGHIATGDADVAQLPSLANANQPDNLEACDDISYDGVEVFALTSQNAQILGTQNPANYLLTYHATQSDAALGINALPDNYTSGNATIYARLKYLGTTDDCFDIVQFNLIVNPYPVPNMSQIWGFCQGGSVTVTAPAGFDDYLWSTGQQGVRSVVISQDGQYTLTVTDGDCQGVFPFEVIMSSPPAIDDIVVSDWTVNDNSITVVPDAGSAGQYLYSIDGINYQQSNVFANLPAGIYTVYIKDMGECGIIQETVFLLNYPKFFTPNGDGHNDFWRIRFSETEPHLMTYIFDRYGKLITGFLPNSPGWDGTYNGEPLPSTDYWFLVIREDGKEHRGHFAMKR